MHNLIKLIISIALAPLLLAGCKDGELKSVVSHATDPERVPTMATNDVQTIISDDGHTRYRITTDRWLMFEEAKDPHWIFPQGVKAEELDSAYAVITTIEGEQQSYPMLPYLDKCLAAMVEEEGGAYFSLFRLMGGAGSMFRWRDKGLAGDDMIHFTRAGARKVGEMLAKQLLEDYDNQYPVTNSEAQ